MAFISPKGDPTRKLFLPLPEREQNLSVFERAHQIMAEHEPSLTRKQRIFYTPGNPFCFLQFSTPENCTKVFNLIAGSFRVQRPRDYVEPKIEAPKIEIPKITENSFPPIGGSVGGEILLAGGSAEPSSVRLLGTAWGSKKLVQDLHEAKNAEEANIAAWEAYDRACAIAAEEEKRRREAIEWAAGAPARKEAARLAAIEEEAERVRLEIVRAERAAKARAKEERRLAAISAEAVAAAAAEKAEKEMFIVNAKNYLWYKSLPIEQRTEIRRTRFSDVASWVTGFNYVQQNGIQV